MMEKFAESGYSIYTLQLFKFTAPSLHRVHDSAQCHSCRKPYFGGLVSCEPAAPPGAGGGYGAWAAGAAGGDVSGGAADAAPAERALADVKTQELLCGKCSAGSGGADCSEHGQVFYADFFCRRSICASRVHNACMGDFGLRCVQFHVRGLRYHTSARALRNVESAEAGGARRGVLSCRTRYLGYSF